MYDVFVSYSRKDADRARCFVDLMRKSYGWAVFFDQTSIRSGDDFAKFIDEKLNESVCVVVLWSDNSVKSEWVTREAAVGLERSCLFPVLLDRLADQKIPAAFQHINATDLSEWDGTESYADLHLLMEPLAEARREALTAVQKADLPQFTDEAWRAVGEALDGNRLQFGWPRREEGSLLLGSFNIRKLGAVARRPQDVWRFLASVCRQFDLLAVQEVMSDLSGLRHLLQLIGGGFSYLVSDVRGYGPKKVIPDRRAFIFNTSRIRHTGLVATVDGRPPPTLPTGRRRKAGNPQDRPLDETTEPFPGFCRQPLAAEFEIMGRPESPPLRFLAINVHLMWEPHSTEFQPLTEWIVERVGKLNAAYPPNVLVFGDLGTNLCSPDRDPVASVQALIPVGEDVDICFPFLERHPLREEVFHTNLGMGEGTGQIAVFSRDKRLQRDMAKRGLPGGSDFGVFDLANLVSVARYGVDLKELDRERQRDLVRAYEFDVSDSIPLWLRISLPGPVI